MSDDCNRTPFWQRQPLLPKGIQDFLRVRLDAALADPEARQGLVWPTVLGAPRLRATHPEGLPESALLDHAARMLGALGHHDPAAAWGSHLEAWPDTAERGPEGWRPHGTWGAFGPLVSLRSGWQLAALTPLPLGERYPLASGVSLFNHGLYHECHDALEPLWEQATGDLKAGLQGLILLAAGYHHLQLQNRSGLVAVWEEALARLQGTGGVLSTSWGEVRFQTALDLTARRLDHGKRMTDDAEFEALWALERPTWELA
ncbi:MAG: hypothetical protein H6P99_2458 [Holophagaceae bacterium]|nr:hypothetical protein [Holophagaceae bacterium]